MGAIEKMPWDQPGSMNELIELGLTTANAGATAALGAEPHELDDAVAMFLLSGVELVHIVPQHNGVAQQPALLGDTRLVLGSQRSETGLVATGILLPRLLCVIEVDGVIRSVLVVGVLDDGIAVGQDPEGADRFAGGVVDHLLLIEDPAAQDRSTSRGGRHGAHLDDVLGVPAVPVVQRVDPTAGLVDAVHLALHVHLVQRWPQRQRGVSEAFNALAQLLVTGLLTPRLAFVVHGLENVEQRHGHEDTGSTEGDVPEGVDLPAGLRQGSDVVLLGRVEQLQLLRDVGERGEEGVVIDPAHPAGVGALRSDVLRERLDQAKVARGELERGGLDGHIQASGAEVRLLGREVVVGFGDEDEDAGPGVTERVQQGRQQAVQTVRRRGQAEQHLLGLVRGEVRSHVHVDDGRARQGLVRVLGRNLGAPVQRAEGRQHRHLDILQGAELGLRAHMVRAEVGAGVVLAPEPRGEGQRRRGGGIDLAALGRLLRRQLGLGLAGGRETVEGTLEAQQGGLVVAVDGPEEEGDGEEGDEGEQGLEPDERHPDGDIRV